MPSPLALPARRSLLLVAALTTLAASTSACGDDADATDGTGGNGSSGSTGTDATSTTSTSSKTTTASGGDCATPLDDETLASLVLSGNGAGLLLGTAAAHPGDTVDFAIGTIACCYALEEVPACATFAIEPATLATIDAAGVVTTDPSTPHGTTFTVTADVENGRRILSADLFVWTEEGNPLAGLYTEEAQLACNGGGERAPEKTIGEIAFRPDGHFGVTWTPFEVYEDYWGTYVFDLDTGALELTVDGGNYVPPDVDPVGTFRFEGDELILEDMYLGTPSRGDAPPACGHVLR